MASCSTYSFIYKRLRLLSQKYLYEIQEHHAVYTTILHGLPQESLFQAHKALVAANNDVIHKVYLKEFCCFNDLAGNSLIFRGRFRVSAGVVVTDDDTRTVAGDRRSEDFRNTYHRTIQCPLIELDIGNHMVFRIKAEDS